MLHLDMHTVVHGHRTRKNGLRRIPHCAIRVGSQPLHESTERDFEIERFPGESPGAHRPEQPGHRPDRRHAVAPEGTMRISFENPKAIGEFLLPKYSTFSF